MFSVSKIKNKYLPIFRAYTRKHGLPVHPRDRALLKYAKAHTGKTVFIIGNGPSVRLSDLDKLTGQVSFAANRFHLCYPQTKFRPTYTVCCDSGVLTQHGMEIALNCGTPLFIPFDASIQNTGLATPNTLEFTQEQPDSAASRYNPLSGLEHGGSVVFIAMQLAIWMGAAKIILYGIDHSFSVPSSASSNGVVTHSGEKNHFIENYREEGEKWWPPLTDLIESSFKEINQYAIENNIEIVNASRKTKLEVFTRVDLDEELKTLLA